MAINFSDFQLDASRRELLRHGEPVHLTPKEFLLLKTLLERRPDAVSKQELYDTLWPSTFVAEVNLPSLIAELRERLGDDTRHPRFIRTVHGFGYAFCGQAEEADRAAAAPPAAVLVIGAREIALHEGETIVGRNASLRCAIDDPSVSRRHAAIVCTPDSARIRDLGSKNGTYVDGRTVTDEEIHDGNVITFGSVRAVFRRGSAQSTITLARSGLMKTP